MARNTYKASETIKEKKQMKKIMTLGLLLILNCMTAQVNIDFNTQQLPQNWSMQGSFDISNAAIHPICQQNSLIGSFFTPSSNFWLQTNTYSYHGNNVNIDVTYGIKDLYHALGVHSNFHKPQLFLEYAEGNSNTWTEHEEITLTNLSQSQTCLAYSTTIDAMDLEGYQTIKYRFVYKSPAQTATLYLLYWSIDDLQIEEQNQTPCEVPQSPQTQNYQTVPNSTTLADLNVTGQNLRWYSDTLLTNEIPETTLVQNTEVYYVTQTINGCESTWNSILVTIEQVPCSTPIPIGNQLQTVSAGTTLSQLDVQGQELKWYEYKDLYVELDETTAVQDSITYYVTQTIDGCESEPLAITILLQSLSVNDFDLLNLKVYPNPVKDILNIISEQEISEIEIFNLLGQQIMIKKINTNIKSIDLSMLLQGNYILKIRSGSNEKILKVIKK